MSHSQHYTQPAFLEGRATTQELAARTAQAWLTNPVNRMQLPQVMMFADMDGDGTIDKEEFAGLLQKAGVRADSARDMVALFEEADKDGSGVRVSAHRFFLFP